MKRESIVFEFKSRNKMEHDPPYRVGKNELKLTDDKYYGPLFLDYLNYTTNYVLLLIQR